jgi:hypothetical protein
VPVVARLTRAELPREQYVGVAECAEVAEREDEYDRHSVAVFVGYTFERGEGGLSVGADYHYKLSECAGITLFGDYVAGDIQAAAFGAGMFFEVAEGLNIVAAPGVEISEEEDEHGGEGEGQDTETKFEFLWRFGASYERELGRGWSVGGAVYVDLVTSGKTPVVVGLSLGKSF